MGHVGRWFENSDDNDTFAEQKHGSQSSVWGMLRREKVPRGVRRSAGPVLHTFLNISVLFQRYVEKHSLICLCRIFSVYLWDKPEQS